MSENIELQEVVVDGMVVKMRRYNIRCHIVCRVLHRCERINLLAKRQNDNTARMLPRCPSHAGTSFYDTVDLAGTLPLAAFFVIIFHVTKCRLLGKRTDCSGTVSLAFSENNLGIAVSISLIITGEIQVDIRLFVSLKSKECFEASLRRPGRSYPACHIRLFLHRLSHPRNQNRCSGISHNNNADAADLPR